MQPLMTMMNGIRYIISLLLYYESRISISFIPSLSDPHNLTRTLLDLSVDGLFGQ